MDTDNFYWIIGAFCLVGLVAGVLWLLKRPSAKSDQQLVPTDNPLQDFIEFSRKVESDRLIVGDETNPVLKIQRFEGDPLQLKPVKIPPEKISTLSGLAQLLPSLADSAMTATTSNMYQLTFSPEVTGDLASGNLTLKESLQGGVRAIAHNGSGKIRGQGSLFSLDKLQRAAAAVATWQILTMALAQKHLADIDEKLEEIKSGLDDIKEWLEADRLGKLEGNMKYLATIAETLLEGSLTETDLNNYRFNIEEIERETLQVIAAQKKAIYQFQEELMKTEFVNWIGTDEDTQLVADKVSEFEKLSRPLWLAFYIRSVACQLLLSLPGENAIIKKRMMEIRSQVDEIKLNRKTRDRFDEMVRGIKSMVNTAQTLNKRRSDLRSLIDTVFDESDSSIPARIILTLDYVENSYSEKLSWSDRPMELVLERSEEDGSMNVYRVER